MLKTEKLTKTEKAFARAAGITAADVCNTGRTPYGTIYSLYNPYYFTEAIYNGYTRSEVYRDLLRRLIDKISIFYCIDGSPEKIMYSNADKALEFVTIPDSLP